MNSYEKIVALIGNPNVGKSTIFNAITKMNQHTGNWPGKTVENAFGEYSYNNKKYLMYDLPGTYSLISHSDEEEVARNFICFNKKDVTIVVCDAVCLERNLNLVLQICEMTDNVIVCVNLMDEALKKKIRIDLNKLSELLNVPVIGSSARSNIGLNKLLKTIEQTTYNRPYKIKYNDVIENAINMIYSNINDDININKRFLSIKLLDDDEIIINEIKKQINKNIFNEELNIKIKEAKNYLHQNDITDLKEKITEEIINKAEEINNEVVIFENKDYTKRDRKIDKLLTNKITGIPIMIISLMFIFYLTIVFSNYPSTLLYNILFNLEDKIYNFFNILSFPNLFTEITVHGAYRVTAFVISVMLPPMIIFFPLFSLLEDSGVLPRIAFNLDKGFKRCNACGKQALTMCMSFGCNAVGITGTRIIDSKRERLIAILTNNFIPCNGRFPTIISIITMFFIVSNNKYNALISSLILTIFILIGILITFITSKILSKTLLKGMPSSFTLELPPYRRPQFFKVIFRSIKDKALKVLLRAIIVSIPAGIIIWIFTNVNIDNTSILNHFTNILDPFGKLIGLDGTIISSFILGIPANEIVIPIALMSYLNTNLISNFDNINALKTIFIDNGWTIKTAICTILFSIMHFPCATTLLTIKKETKSIWWTFLSFIIPTITGIIICFIISNLLNLFI